MKFGKGTGEVQAKDDKNADFNMQPAEKKKIEQLLENTKWDNTDKFGEGDFALRLTVDNNDIKVELVDKSNFNGGKEYVMDSQTIKDGAKSGAGDTKTVILAGQEIKFKDLKDNFVDLQPTAPNNKAIKTLDINIKNEVMKDEKGQEFDIKQNQPPNQENIKKLLENTKWDNTDKFGEGDFALRLTVEDNTGAGGTKDVKVELVDKSNFNGGKEYVMDSQTIKGNNANFPTGTEKVTLAGQEIVFNELETNFTSIKPTNPANGKTIKTLDININKSGNTIELKNKKKN